MFAEEIGPVAFTSMAVTVLTVIGGGVMALLNWRKQSRKEQKKDDQEEEDHIIARWQTLLDRQKKECDDELRQRDARIDRLEVRLEQMGERLDEIRRANAAYASRVMYAEAVARGAGGKLEPWTPPSSGTDTHTPIGGGK